MSHYDPKFMQRAIELSELSYKSGKGLPIGCVVVKNGQIVGEGHNEIFLRKNPTAHGEMVAIENACKHLNDLSLKDCDLYTTLQPCPMCLGAIYWAGLRTVYYANAHKDAADVGFDDSFIFGEFKLEPEKRRIPMKSVRSEEAVSVLKAWKALESHAAQPWSGE